MKKTLLFKFYNHLKTVSKHKFYVAKLCIKAGLPLRGIIHDLSKFSLSEMKESIVYYQGDKSPINACRDDIGYSCAWLHHKGRNKHHYEYWIDSCNGYQAPIKIPYEYATEMICDTIGASMAYNGKNFNIKMPYEYWKVNENNEHIHKDTRMYVLTVLLKFSEQGPKVLNKKYLKKIYKKY
jgi:hypothetical protein